MSELTRRDAMVAAGAGAAAVSLAGGPVLGEGAPSVVPAFAGTQQPTPLRFGPA